MFKILLFPFELLYTIVTSLRNWLYDLNIFASTKFEVPLISIGNLKVGGTGKTPHTEYISRLFMELQNVAILSRGYGRKTKGYILAGSNDSPETIGDEPYQYFWKWKSKISVAVCEKRVEGVQQLLTSKNPPALILLDDAFQHRAIDPGLKILLTEYHKPFYNDRVLPAGRLRESRAGAGRADIIIVTKCPADLSEAEAEQVKNRIQGYNSHASVYFTCIRYGNPQPLTPASARGENQQRIKEKADQVILLTGIADASILYSDLKKMSYTIKEHKNYRDHKTYSDADILAIVEDCKNTQSVLITTEKDAVKIKEGLSDDFLAYYIPIEVDFLWGKDQFNKRLILFSMRK